MPRADVGHPTALYGFRGCLPPPNDGSVFVSGECTTQPPSRVAVWSVPPYADCRNRLDLSSDFFFSSPCPHTARNPRYRRFHGQPVPCTTCGVRWPTTTEFRPIVHSIATYFATRRRRSPGSTGANVESCVPGSPSSSNRRWRVSPHIDTLRHRPPPSTFILRPPTTVHVPETASAARSLLPQPNAVFHQPRTSTTALRSLPWPPVNSHCPPTTTTALLL